MKTLDFRCGNVSSRRLIEQVTHCLVEWLIFEEVHQTQYEYFRYSNEYIGDYVNKYCRHSWMVTLFDTYSQDIVFKSRYYYPWNDLGQVTHG